MVTMTTREALAPIDLDDLLAQMRGTAERSPNKKLHMNGRTWAELKRQLGAETVEDPERGYSSFNGLSVHIVPEWLAQDGWVIETDEDGRNMFPMCPVSFLKEASSAQASVEDPPHSD